MGFQHNVLLRIVIMTYTGKSKQSDQHNSRDDDGEVQQVKQRATFLSGVDSLMSYRITLLSDAQLARSSVCWSNY